MHRACSLHKAGEQLTSQRQRKRHKTYDDKLLTECSGEGDRSGARVASLVMHSASRACIHIVVRRGPYKRTVAVQFLSEHCWLRPRGGGVYEVCKHDTAAQVHNGPASREGVSTAVKVRERAHLCLQASKRKVKRSRQRGLIAQL